MTLNTVPTLADVADEAAASQDVRDYLRCRGIMTVGTLALIAADEPTFRSTLIDPLMSGWRSGTTTINLAEAEKPIATAMLLHMWGVCKRHWADSMVSHRASTTTTPSTSTPAAKSTADDKPPRTLPPGVWGTLVNSYNKVQLDGRDRAFPTQIVLGAEGVLARLYHEHNHSKLYTPLLLGEVLQHRSFQSSGEVNPLAKQNKKAATLTLEDGVLIEKDEKGSEPRSILAILDGLEATRWATILVQLGPEQDVHRYIDWMVQRIRSRPTKTEQFNAYWTSCAWKIAMGMREGQSYTHLVETVMKDFDRFADFMSREEATPKKSSANTKGKQNEITKGYGKSPKGKHSQRPQPYGRPRWSDGQPQGSFVASSWNSSSSWPRSSSQQSSSRWYPPAATDGWSGGADHKDTKNK